MASVSSATASDGIAHDRLRQIVHVVSCGPSASLVSIPLGVPGEESWRSDSSPLPAAALQIPIRLSGAKNVSNLWNLEYWEAGDRLIGVVPYMFQTQIVQLDIKTGMAHIIFTVSGIARKGIHCHCAGRYYFLIRNLSSHSLVQVTLTSGETKQWAHVSFDDMLSLHCLDGIVAAAQMGGVSSQVVAAFRSSRSRILSRHETQTAQNNIRVVATSVDVDSTEAQTSTSGQEYENSWAAPLNVTYLDFDKQVLSQLVDGTQLLTDTELESFQARLDSQQLLVPLISYDAIDSTSREHMNKLAFVSRNGSHCSVLRLSSVSTQVYRDGLQVWKTDNVIGMLLSYRSEPRVLSVFPPLALAAARTRVKVLGTNFGMSDSSPTVTIGDARTQVATWSSDTSIAFTVPPTMRITKQVAVLQVGAQQASTMLDYTPSFNKSYGVIAEGQVVSIDGVYDGREEHVCVWSQANSSHALAVPRAAGKGAIRTATTFVHSNLLHCAAPEWNVPAECSKEDLGCHSHISLSILVNNVTYLPAAADTRPLRVAPRSPAQLVAVSVPIQNYAHVKLSPLLVSVADAKGRTCSIEDADIHVKAHRLGPNVQPVNLSESSASTSHGLAIFQLGAFPRGSYALEFKSSKLATLSIMVNVSHGVGHRIRVVTQPTHVTAGSSGMQSNLAVEIIDSHGSIVLDWPHLVYIHLRDQDMVCLQNQTNCTSTAEGKRKLQGSVSSAAVNGLVSFPNVMIEGLAGVMFWSLSSANLSATTEAILITAGTPTVLHLDGALNSSIDQLTRGQKEFVPIQNNPVYISMLPIDPMRVTVRDKFGNLVDTNSTIISAQLCFVENCLAVDGSVDENVNYDSETTGQFVARANASNTSKDVSFEKRSRLPDVSGQLFGTTSLISNRGVAVFENLHVDKKGLGYMLFFSSLHTAGVKTVAFSVWPGTAASLLVFQEPSDGISRMVLQRQPIVGIVDSGQNIILASSFVITVSILEPAEKMLSDNDLDGPQYVSAEYGRAAFCNLSVGSASTNHRLVFVCNACDGRNLSALSASFAINHSFASDIIFDQAVVNITVGLRLWPAPVVRVVDDFGNTVQNAVERVAVQLMSGHDNQSLISPVSYFHDVDADGHHILKSTLQGKSSSVTVKGIAAFSNLTVIAPAHEWYRLAVRAKDSNVTRYSQRFYLMPGPASRVVFHTQPSSHFGGATSDPAAMLCVADLAGNVLVQTTQGKILVVAVHPNRSLSVTWTSFWEQALKLAAAATSPFSVAEVDAACTTIAPMPVNLIGAYKLLAAFASQTTTSKLEVNSSAHTSFNITNSTNPTIISSVWGIASAEFNVTLGPAHRVQLLTQPSGNFVLCQSSTLWFDSFGADCSDYNEHEQDWCGFEDSSAHCCICGGGTSSVGAVVGVPFSIQPVAQSVDLGGNAVSSYNGSLTATAISRGMLKLRLTGTTTVSSNASTGSVQFTDLAILDARDGIVLRFHLANNSKIAVDSKPFDVLEGNVSQLLVIVQPGNAIGAESLQPQPRVIAADVGGNHLNLTATLTVTLVSDQGAAQILGNRAANLQENGASFTDLSVDMAGTDYKLEFQLYEASLIQVIDNIYSGTLTQISPVVTCRSASFNVSAGAPFKLGLKLPSPNSSNHLQVKAGHNLSNLELQVQDRGGNVLADRNQTALVSVHRRVVSKHYLECRGVGECFSNLPNISSLLPAGNLLISASLDMYLACTDFDSDTEMVDKIEIASKVVRGGFGSWPTCHDNCSQTVRILSNYDVSAWAKDSGLTVRISASPDVDYPSCQGDTVVVQIELTIIAAQAYNQTVSANMLHGPRSLSFVGSRTLEDLSMSHVGAGKMLLFESQTSLFSTFVWIQVVQPYAGRRRSSEAAFNATPRSAIVVSEP